MDKLKRSFDKALVMFKIKENPVKVDIVEGVVKEVDYFESCDNTRVLLECNNGRGKYYQWRVYKNCNDKFFPLEREVKIRSQIDKRNRHNTLLCVEVVDK
ncbi:hypothetical protein KJ855_01370 [Patescibacteria group bacterium]|nr:hypothetical protein [Patescibacteria group bacterium]